MLNRGVSSATVNVMKVYEAGRELDQEADQGDAAQAIKMLTCGGTYLELMSSAMSWSRRSWNQS